MNRTTLHRSLLEAQEQARAWGWPFALGAAGLVAALAMALAWVQPLRQESVRLEAETHAADLRATRLSAQRKTTELSVPAPQRFRAAFPPIDARQERVAALLTQATQHQLESRRSDFQLNTDRELGLIRYTMVMPLTGPYAKLRQFVEEAQAHDPSLSLDRLRMHRASASTPVVEGELTWSFYMQPGDAASARPTTSAQPASAAL